MGLYDNMRNEPVRSLRLRKPVTLPPTSSVRDAVEQMRSRRLGCTIIVDDDGKPLGMFTESMLTKMLATLVSFLDDPLEQHMATRWPHVKDDDPVRLVLEIMQTRNIRFICVVDEEGRLVGLTGQKGLLEYIADHFPEQIMVQRIGTSPYMHSREGA